MLPIKGCSLDPAWSSFNSFPGDAFSESASITIIIVIYDLNHQIQLLSIRITIKTWQDQEMLSSLISTMLGGNAEIQVPIRFSFQSDVLIVRYNVFGCYSNHTDMDVIVNFSLRMWDHTLAATLQEEQCTTLIGRTPLGGGGWTLMGKSKHENSH